MTKLVRVENADAGTAFHPVVHRETLQNGKDWVRDENPVHLDFPTRMLDCWLTDSVRYVIEEARG